MPSPRTVPSTPDHCDRPSASETASPWRLALVAPSVPVLVAIALIVAQLVIRGWLAGTGNFYWDDLILIGRASTQPILSWEFLGHSHDGHFMPAAFLVAGVSTVLAPVTWALPAATLVVLQAIASLAVWRMIRTVVPPAADGPTSRRDLAALGALAFYLFTPMTVAGFVWWAAGLNTLPMQAAMAWIVADAVILVRGDVDPRRARLIVIRSAVVFVVALAFFEKSLFILPVAFAAAVLAARFSDRPPLTVAFVRGRRLWTVLGIVFVAWALAFVSISDATAGEHSISQTAHLVWRSIDNAVVPSLVGGPWDWQRWVPSPPMGFAPVWMIVAGWVLAAALVVVAVRLRTGAIAVLICAALYVVVAQIPVMWNRSSANTALELAQTMRYLPDSALVLTLAAALIIGAPARRDVPAAPRHARVDDTSESPMTAPAVPAGLLVGAVLFASSMLSLASYQSSWTDDPTGPYLDNATRALAANRDHRMFDQQLPLEVLLPVAFPENQISHTFGRVSDRPEFGGWTDRLNVLDPAGNLTAGAVTPQRTIVAGRGTCARPELTGPADLRLDGPLLRWRWTLALTYCANRSGEVEFSLDGGSPIRVPVTAGLHAVYVQLDGSGTAVHVRPITAGLALHTGEGRVGEVVDAALLGG
ncbi:hypothetical protein [Gordonia sp. NB41Y]|uniref:hypothetical protein n=1 Tax=Gordonia sp. NB41Y TaxID=875808 RepID=UPI0021C8E538|nr:hypothetical protein [Gordonia sp. NB41Y]WLP91932.1 hypothetical protein Q9K23_06720 [Gordonia sp. NB41Y]